jgi:peptide/nickel transport system permease protein
MIDDVVAGSPAGQGQDLLAVNRPRARRRQETRFGWGSRVALGVMVLILLCAIVPELLSPYSPIAQNISVRLTGPTGHHLLGTDVDGRDTLSRIIWGSRDAITGVAIALAGTIVLGIPWGLIAGYGGAVVDEILMRVADALLSFPGIVLAIAITGILGPSLRNAMLAVSVVFAPIIARLMRSAVLPLRNAEFVMVSRALGANPLKVTFRHVVPNALAPVLVQLFGLASLSFIIEAALSFLGLGVQPPTASWGADLAQAYTNFTAAPLNTVAPGITITLAALSVSAVGDGVRRLLVI